MVTVKCTLSQEETILKELFNSFEDMRKKYPKYDATFKRIFLGHGLESPVVNVYRVNRKSTNLIGWKSVPNL